MTVGRLVSVRIGQTTPLGPAAVPSAFVKHAVAGPVVVGTLGIIGDEQADLTVHGGPEKAVYAYPDSHYALWATDYPEHETQFVAGGVGENLTVGGLAEDDLCVGDVHAIGSTLLQACQPRQPCFKFALRFGDNRLVRAMVRNGRAGWYYRVLRDGEFEAGDAIRLEARPNPAFRFSRLVEIANFRNATPAEVAQLANMAGLASDFRDRARAALELGVTSGVAEN